MVASHGAGREAGPVGGTQERHISSPHGRARAMALLSLCCGVLVFVAVAVFLVRNGVYVVVGLIGAALGVASGWWVATGRAWRRAAGWAGLSAGVALVIFAVLVAGHGSLASVIRLALAMALLAGAVLSAQAAVMASLRVSQPGVAQRVPPPVHPVLLCNPWSGGGKVDRFGLRDVAASLGVETVMLDHGLDLAELAERSITDGADCLGMAGGDGSQALVASLAVEHDLPFVCVAAGTRNHFALDLGLDRDDPRKSVRAFTDARERRVDYGMVNGRFFVNNVSLGVYATIVQQEGYREAKAETTQALLPELLGRQDQPFDLQFTTPDGTEVDGAFLIMISNNPYILGPAFDVSQRRRLDSGQLGVLRGERHDRYAGGQGVCAGPGGSCGIERPRLWFSCTEFEVRSRSGSIYAGIDGEALELASPLRFQIHAGGLRMLVPEGKRRGLSTPPSPRRAPEGSDRPGFAAVMRSCAQSRASGARNPACVGCNRCHRGRVVP